MALKMGKPSRGEETKAKILNDLKDEAPKPMARLVVEMEADTKKALKAKAVSEDRAISDIVRELVEGYLSK